MTNLALLGALASAAALGLSPYAALAVAGFAGYLGLAETPETLLGLAAPPLWATLALLALLDGLLSRNRLTDLVWNSAHILVKPLAALLYVAAALGPALGGLAWAAALSGLVIALLVHISVLAVRASTHTAGPAAQRPGFTLVRLVAAGTLAWLALRVPPYAAFAAATLVLAPLPWLPRRWGAARMALASLLAILTRPARTREWELGLATLPPSWRKAATAELEASSGQLRSAPVTLARFGPHWRYQPGRLLVGSQGPPLFVYRRWPRPVVLTLTPGSGAADGRALVETVWIEGPVPYVLCLGAAAPPGPAILAVLRG